MPGLFITLEGGEGSGKSTQLAGLGRRLQASGCAVLLTREPGGTGLGERVRALLVEDSEDPPSALAELLLYAADRAHHVATRIRPALQAGQVVLCDRYADATTAYQGWGRQLPLELVARVNALATDGLWPQRTVLLDLPPELGVARSLARLAGVTGPQEVRFEAESCAFHERVRDGYRQLAAAHPDRFRVVQASGSVAAVESRVWAAVADLVGPGAP